MEEIIQNMAANIDGWMAMVIVIFFILIKEITAFIKSLKKSSSEKMYKEKSLDVLQKLDKTNERILEYLEIAAKEFFEEVNKEQAKHPSLFVSGARPAIMWVCCLGLLWQFFVGPILTWATGIWMPDVVPPQLEVEGLITLVMSLLGLGAMRSFEKSKKVARDNLK